MAPVQQRSTRNAGRGLFSTESVGAGQEILRVERPLLASLDTPHLKDTCNNCFIWISETVQPLNNSLTVWQGAEAGQQVKPLKACLGCKVVSYCSKVGSSSKPQSFLFAGSVFSFISIETVLSGRRSGKKN